MNKTDLMNIVASLIKQYERDNDQIVGCGLWFETDIKSPTSKGAFDWHGFQFNGTKFHDEQKIELRVVK